jgi:hypothetical protein
MLIFVGIVLAAVVALHVFAPQLIAPLRALVHGR